MTRFTKGKTLDELMDMLANCEPGSVNHSQVTAEITLLQITMQNASLEAQKLATEAETRAAYAAEAAAKAANINVKYMFWSVVFAATSAIITAAGVAFNVFEHH